MIIWRFVRRNSEFSSRRIVNCPANHKLNNSDHPHPHRLQRHLKYEFGFQCDRMIGIEIGNELPSVICGAALAIDLASHGFDP